MATDRAAFLDRIRPGGVIFDGGMGSMLIAAGLQTGHPPEEWNLSRPDTIAAVHRAYLDAGADVITTNTFGATPARMARHGLAERFREVNRRAVELARGAADDAGRGLVALSLGPTGMMFPPMGNATEDAIAGEFAGQLEVLDGGFDLIVIETVYDRREGLIALAAARAYGSTPVAVTATFNRTPRGFFTVMGDDVATTVAAFADGGATMVGSNCSIASADMVELAPFLRAATKLPLLCQPNAGAPRMDGATATYDQDPDAFAADGKRLFELGVNAVGGCCGTDPDFIRLLAGEVRS
jgi:methionine synthase I (cobalamin-dependent)